MHIVTYKIAKEIFLKQPGFKRAVIAFPDVVNLGTPPEVWEIFKQTLAAVKEVVPTEGITYLKQIAAWRTAFKSMGINPTNDKPAIEALLRRAVNNPEGFRPINLAVDLGNIASLKYMMPVGIHPITSESKNIELRLASGDETYTDFSGTKTEMIPVNEVVLTDGNTVLTRKWVWRQSRQSLIEVSTGSFFVNLDFILPEDEIRVHKIVEEIRNSYEKYFNKSVGTFLLSKSNPFISNLLKNE